MYTKTNWVDNETPVNAENMNKIENALETHENALEDKKGAKGDKGDTGDSGLTKQTAIADAVGGDEKDKINAYFKRHYVVQG